MLNGGPYSVTSDVMKKTRMRLSKAHVFIVWQASRDVHQFQPISLLLIDGPAVYSVLYRGVEQLVAHRAHNPKVAGSNPAPATTTGVDLTVSACFLWARFFYGPCFLWTQVLYPACRHSANYSASILAWLRLTNRHPSQRSRVDEQISLFLLR